MKCQDKRLYIDHGADIIAQRWVLKYCKKETRVYKCPICKGYHLTHQLGNKL